MSIDQAAAMRVLTVHGWQVEQGGPVMAAACPAEMDDGVLPAACVEAVGALTLARGALVLRGLIRLTPENFGLLVQLVAGGPLLSYTERSSPRTEILPCVYTSTEYAPREEIFFHSENSYQTSWPGMIAFWCRRPAQRGGATPIVDIRRLPDRLSARTLNGLVGRGYMIVRNYAEQIGLDWTEVFGTTDRAAVERYCRANGLTVEWLSAGRLRTRAVRPVLARHPLTGVPVWFNHLAFFNVSTLRPALRDALLSTVDADELPSNTLYGSGTGFESDLLKEINAAYAAEAIDVQWSAGDVLLLDNMAFAHGRRAHAGEREVYVAMSRPFGWAATPRGGVTGEPVIRTAARHAGPVAAGDLSGSIAPE